MVAADKRTLDIDMRAAYDAHAAKTNTLRADIAQLDDIIDKFLDYARPDHAELKPVLLLMGDDNARPKKDPRIRALKERFPDVKVMAEWPDVALPKVGIDHYTAFVALTHDPKIDDPGLALALKSDCFYIGALGSRKTHARRVERLKAELKKITEERDILKKAAAYFAKELK